jgi:plasmid stabilization system protein ParE
MKRKLIARPRAEIDIIEHLIFLNEREPKVSSRFRLAVQEAFEAIATAPRAGAAIPQASMPGVDLRFVRPRRFKNYLVMYQVTDDAIFVLRVLHAGQNLESALRL